MNWTKVLIILGLTGLMVGVAMCGDDSEEGDDDASADDDTGGDDDDDADAGDDDGGFEDDDDDDTDDIVDTETGETGLLVGVIRDFGASHPDFEAALGAEEGIVAEVIGTDQKPVYAGGAGTQTTHGKAAFDQWYRDVGGVNMRTEHEIQLEHNTQTGMYTYDNPEFFPIDGELMGNEGNAHNYHFTYEIHTEFTYKGGEVFGFTGDDDLFVFINGRLAIDLGGVHSPLSAQADLDALAQQLQITKDNSYPLDFFFAERHTVLSNFRIETTIEDLTPIVIE